MLAWLRSRPRWFVVVSATLVVGGAWLFLGILEDVVTRDPLVEVDVLIYDVLQMLRGPLADRLMRGTTALGDVEVVLPVIVAALAWFVANRYWRTAIFWLVAVGVAEILVMAIGLALRRSRPPGASMAYSFSFPSGHAALSVVVYGFLAFLVSVGVSNPWRLVCGFSVAMLVAAIAFSRLYLGVHWMSDVLAGLGLGTAWVAALAVAYLDDRAAIARTGSLAAIVLATFVVAAVVHGTRAGPDLGPATPPALRS